MKSPYSPDKFMSSLYESTYKSPFEGVTEKQSVEEIIDSIKLRTKSIFKLENIPDKVEKPRLVPTGKPLEYKDYTLQKNSVEICKNLTMAVYVLTPKNIAENAPAVVALCGHGYGVRHILRIKKSGRKKHLPYIDNYQKDFAVELCKRGCIVIAPELFGFGEARLQKDLIKPFYISSCDELSHHLLPHGLTTASMRIYQTLVCAELLRNMDKVDKNRLSVMGISGGGLTALYSALLDEEIKKIVVSGYVNSFRESIFARWHCPDNYIPDMLTTGEIYDFACAIAPRELCVESGERDKLFPISASRTAHGQLKKIYTLMNAEQNLTIDVFDGKHQVSGKKSFEILSR